MCEKGGLCILRIHDIFSACVVWFTFVSRTQEHRAVGSSGIGLTDSRGSFPLWDCLSLTSWVKYNTLSSVCQEVFWTFLFGREILFYFTQLRIGERLFAPVCLLTLLLYHTQLGLSRYNFSIYKVTTWLGHIFKSKIFISIVVLSNFYVFKQGREIGRASCRERV